MKHAVISNNVIRRLPRYLRKLDELEKQGVSRISSSQLGEILGLTPSQIRQDFSCFGSFGQQGYGYSVTSLKEQISQILGMDRDTRAILVGVGNIGRSLIDKFNFNDWGVTLDAAFDVNPALIGTTFRGVPVKSDKELIPYLNENKVDIAVLTVPREVAKEATQQLLDNGVEAIWNFTNVEIVDPYSKAIVENLHFSDSLLALSYYLSERRDREAEENQ